MLHDTLFMFRSLYRLKIEKISKTNYFETF